MTSALPEARAGVQAREGLGRPRRRWTRARIRRWVLSIVLIPICFIWIYPMLWMISSSLKTNGEIFQGLNLIPSVLQLGNYITAWVQADIGHDFLNSVIVTLGGVAVVLVVTSTMGYVIGRYPFPGRRILIGFLAAIVFLPQGFTILPILEEVTWLHLNGSLFGIILAESGSVHTVMILLFAGYFAQLPPELEESATVDGAGFLRVFWQIYLPLAKPVIATVIIMQFIASWNDFLIPLVLTLTQPTLRTLAVGVYTFQGTNQVQWADLTAASTIALLPILAVFLILQRYFIEGIAGAVKQ
ncbi:MAG: carbohydrate ABC transporter permease [Candidatus Dormibacteraeota bacterium]|nr:carbohydrate ABC transporter permease [Candidatus Dormibacteraeota bacterium]